MKHGKEALPSMVMMMTLMMMMCNYWMGAIC